MTSAEVKAALARRHANAGQGAWVCVEEAFSGFAAYDMGGIDLLAVGVWQSAKVPGLRGCGRRSGRIVTSNPLVAYEVKVSRADMRRELYGYVPGEGAKWAARAVPPWPGKARGAIARTHYFVFAVPVGLLHDHEIERREPWPDGIAQPPAPGDDDGQLALATQPKAKGNLWVPEGCGLVEVGGNGVRVRVHADPSEAQPWNRHEIHEVMRRVEECTRRAIRVELAA